MSYSVGGGLSIEGETESGPCFMACVILKNIEGSGSLGTHFEHEKMKDVGDSDTTHTHQTSVTWSYSTSGEPQYAGKLSDSFLLNTLVIIFRETRTIQFNETTCTASEAPRTVTFDVGSQENRKPLSFVSYFQVVNEIQPQLERVLASKIAESNGRPSEAESPAPSPDQIESQINITQNGINAWRTILAEYEDTHAMAQNKTLPPVKDFFKVRKAREPFCQRRKYTVALTSNQIVQLANRERIQSIGVSSILPFASDGELSDVSTGKPSSP